MSEIVGDQLKKGSIDQQARRKGWVEKMEVKKGIGKKPEENPMVEASKPIENTNATQEVHFQIIGGMLKSFGYKTLGASSRLVNALCMVIEAETIELEALLNIERTQKLTIMQKTKRETLIASLSEKEKQVREYIKPSSVAQYLKLAGIEAELGKGDDGIEREAFTPAALQEAVEKMMKEAHEEQKQNSPIKYIEDVDKEQLRIESELGITLPEIDATKVKDEANEGLTEQETDLVQYQSLYYANAKKINA